MGCNFGSWFQRVWMWYISKKMRAFLPIDPSQSSCKCAVPIDDDSLLNLVSVPCSCCHCVHWRTIDTCLRNCNMVLMEQSNLDHGIITLSRLISKQITRSNYYLDLLPQIHVIRPQRKMCMAPESNGHSTLQCSLFLRWPPPQSVRSWNRTVQPSAILGVHAPIPSRADQKSQNNKDISALNTQSIIMHRW